MVRREADEGDPFVDVLFKLRVNEKELLDEWVAQTTLTRSGFVTVAEVRQFRHLPPVRLS